MQDKELTNFLYDTVYGTKTVKDEKSVYTPTTRESYSLKDLKKDNTFNTTAARFLTSVGRNSENIFEYLRDTDASPLSAITRSFEIGNWSSQDVQDYNYLRETFDNAEVGGFQERLGLVKDYAIDIFTDPISWLAGIFAVPTRGTSLKAQAAARGLVQKGLKKLSAEAKSEFRKEGFKTGLYRGAPAFAVEGGLYDYFNQTSDIKLGVDYDDKINWDSLLGNAAFSGVAGGALSSLTQGLNASRLLKKEFDFSNDMMIAKRATSKDKNLQAKDFYKEYEDFNDFEHVPYKENMSEWTDRIFKTFLSKTVGKTTTEYLNASKSSKTLREFIKNLRNDFDYTLGDPSIKRVAEETFGQYRGRLQGFGLARVEKALDNLRRTGFFNVKVNPDDNLALFTYLNDKTAKTFLKNGVETPIPNYVIDSGKEIRKVLNVLFREANKSDVIEEFRFIKDYFPRMFNYSALSQKDGRELLKNKIIEYNHAEPINVLKKSKFRLDNAKNQRLRDLSDDDLLLGIDENEVGLDVELFDRNFEKDAYRFYLKESGIGNKQLKKRLNEYDDYARDNAGESILQTFDDETLVNRILDDARELKADAIIDNMLEYKWTPFEFRPTGQVGQGKSFLKQRVFSNIPANEIAPILETDVETLLKNYIVQSAQTTARGKYFGFSLDTFNKRYLEPIRKQLLDAGMPEADVLKIQKKVQDTYLVVTGLSPQRIQNNVLSKASDYTRLFNQMAHLPLATISSLSEPVILLQRAGLRDTPAVIKDIAGSLVKETKRTFNRVLGGIKRKRAGKEGARNTFKDLKDDEYFELYETGLALESAVLDRIEGLTGEALESGFAKKLQNIFFRGNLLEQWTRSVQLASFTTGKRLIMRNIENLYNHSMGVEKQNIFKLNKTDFDYFQDQLAELQINPKEAVEWYGSQTDKFGVFQEVNARSSKFYKQNILKGANQFTKEVILNPSNAEANRPLWFGSPAGQLLMQFAGYPTVFSNTVLKRFARESGFQDLARGNVKKAFMVTSPKTIGTVIAMTGVAVIGDYLRSRGESFENKEPGEIITRGIRRFGGFGPFDYGDRFMKELEFNRNLLVGVPKSVLGPAAQDVVDGIRFGTGVGDLFSRNFPGIAAFDLIGGEGTKKDFNKYFRELDKDLYEAITDSVGVSSEKNLEGIATFSTGGEVNIPNAPVEPDQRVDRMTGVPYDEQAGPAFQDEEDRIGFIFGGLTSLARIAAMRATDKITKQFKNKNLTPAQKIEKKKSAESYINKVQDFNYKIDDKVNDIIKTKDDIQRNKKIKKLQDFVKQSDIFDSLEEDRTFYRREDWLENYLKNAFEEAGLEYIRQPKVKGGLLKTLQKRQKKVVGGKIAKLVKLNYSKLKGKDIKIPSIPKQGDTKSLENFLIDDKFKNFGVLTFDKNRLNKIEKDFSLDLDDYENTLRELFFTKREDYRFLKDMVKKNKNLPDELISKKIKQIKNLTNELSISDVQKLNKLTNEQVSKVLKKLRAEIKHNEKFYGGMNYIDVEAIINSVKNPRKPKVIGGIMSALAKQAAKGALKGSKASKELRKNYIKPKYLDTLKPLKSNVDSKFNMSARDTFDLLVDGKITVKQATEYLKDYGYKKETIKKILRSFKEIDLQLGDDFISFTQPK